MEEYFPNVLQEVEDLNAGLKDTGMAKAVAEELEAEKSHAGKFKKTFATRQ